MRRGRASCHIQPIGCRHRANTIGVGQSQAAPTPPDRFGVSFIAPRNSALFFGAWQSTIRGRNEHFHSTDSTRRLTDRRRRGGGRSDPLEPKGPGPPQAFEYNMLKLNMKNPTRIPGELGNGDGGYPISGGPTLTTALAFSPGDFFRVRKF